MMHSRTWIVVLMTILTGCSSMQSVGRIEAPLAISPPPPIECLMMCVDLPEPSAPDMDAVRAWAFRAIQHYEICAARHNACAARLEMENHHE